MTQLDDFAKALVIGIHHFGLELQVGIREKSGEPYVILDDFRTFLIDDAHGGKYLLTMRGGKEVTVRRAREVVQAAADVLAEYIRERAVNEIGQEVERQAQ